jgi:hypothetical protein
LCRGRLEGRAGRDQEEGGQPTPKSPSNLSRSSGF